jgi:hypothetical protein
MPAFMPAEGGPILVSATPAAALSAAGRSDQSVGLWFLKETSRVWHKEEPPIRRHALRHFNWNSLTTRFGCAFNSWLVYGKVGGAWVDVSASVNAPFGFYRLGRGNRQRLDSWRGGGIRVSGCARVSTAKSLISRKENRPRRHTCRNARLKMMQSFRPVWRETAIR